MSKSLISYIKKVWLVVVISLLVGALLTGFVTHAYFPKIVEKEKIVYKEVQNITIIEKPQPKPSSNVKSTIHSPPERERIERNEAYVITNNEKVKAGSDYTNEPDRCAKLHKRNC